MYVVGRERKYLEEGTFYLVVLQGVYVVGRERRYLEAEVFCFFWWSCRACK